MTFRVNPTIGVPTQFEGNTGSCALPAITLTGKLLCIVIVSDATQPAVVDNDGVTAWESVFEAVAHSILHTEIQIVPWSVALPDPVSFDTTDSNGGYAVVFAIDDPLASGADPLGAVSTNAFGLASATVTANDFTPSGNGQLVIAVATAMTVLLRTCGVFSGTAPTFAENFDNGASSVGAGAFFSIAIDSGVQTTAAPTGSRTATLSGVAIENQGVMFSIKPVPVALTGNPGAFFFL